MALPMFTPPVTPTVRFTSRADAAPTMIATGSATGAGFLRRGHPLIKAIAGVVVLLAGATVAGAAAVRVVHGMITENGKTRLERFTDGTDDPTIVTLGEKGALMRVALPSAPQTSHERMTFFGVEKQVERRISTAGDASVQLLWFDVIPALAQDPEKTLDAIAKSQAGNLGGAAPIDPQVISGGADPAYEFRVHLAKTSTGSSDYYVRLVLHRNVVYVLRVQAKIGGAEARAKVAASIRFL